MSLSKQIVCSPRASERIAAARAWIGSLAPGTEALVVAASHEAADDLLREFTVSRGASFGVHRLTLNRLIGVLAAEHMVNAALAPAAGLAAEAVAARFGRSADALPRRSDRGCAGMRPHCGVGGAGAVGDCTRAHR